MHTSECECRKKATPRDEISKKQLYDRISRMTGQLGGIKKMIEEDRYCGDILNQVAAVQNALQAFGYCLLQDHMESCVTQKIKDGDKQVIKETVDLIKKLK